MVERTVVESDVLIIGGGMAGLFAAIKAAMQGARVALADKGYIGKASGAYFAEGDVMFFRASRDHDIDRWLDVLCQRGDFLNNREWDRICLLEAEDRFNDLVSWGVEFRTGDDGEVAVWSPPFGDDPFECVCMKNRRYTPTMRKKAAEVGVKLLDKVMFCELIWQDGKVVGAAGFNTITGEVIVAGAKAVIIAAGSSVLSAGASNIAFYTGDGDAMAYRVGAKITGKEFSFGAPSIRSLYRMREKAGKQPLDADAAVDNMSRTPYVTIPSGWPFADMNACGEPVLMPAWDVHCGKAPLYADTGNYSPEMQAFAEDFFAKCGTAELDKLGLDLRARSIIELPATRPHGECDPIFGGCGIMPGGFDCAADGIPGLFVAGNSCAAPACGSAYAGMGFGLNHAMVTGNRAANSAVEYSRSRPELELDQSEIERAGEVVLAPLSRASGFSPQWVLQALRGVVVPYYVLQVKKADRLQAALTFVEFLGNHVAGLIRARDAHELRKAHEAANTILNAEMRLRSSLFRTESRCGHFREDFPRRSDPDWLAWVVLQKQGDQMGVSKKPIPREWWPDPARSYEEKYASMLPLESELVSE